jgi:hypothetical protein
MSSQLINVFMADTPVHLDGSEGQPEGDAQLIWKVVLRTGTWKLRPGPGGVKLNAPLKIYRDQAPKGHISLTSLKANFDAGAKEHVTLPVVHADGTSADSGFVRKLVIQDVPGEDGTGAKESMLWAGIDVTDSEIKRKISEKSLVGVSGGILFDYERTEDGKKFDQVLSHVMVTNSPWINGTGGFQDRLPDDVMASEPKDLPIGEVEFQSRETEREPELPKVKLADPPAPPKRADWQPEKSFGYARSKVEQALARQREALLASIPKSSRYEADWPTSSVQNISLSEEGGEALIAFGYGSEADAWVAGFRYDQKGEVELEPFVRWVTAKPEWVAMSEGQTTPKPSVRPAGRGRPNSAKETPPVVAGSLFGLGLREAQMARAERLQLGSTSTTTGGHMGLSDLLSGVELSDEQREAIRVEEQRLARFEASDAERRQSEQQARIVALCGSPDGQTKGLLDQAGLSDPGVKKYVRNVMLSDDGGTALELSEHTESGKTTGVAKTASQIIEEFIKVLPKGEDGRVSLADQARRLPDDVKPADDVEEKPKSAKDSADELYASLSEQGFAGALNITTPQGA